MQAPSPTRVPPGLVARGLVPRLGVAGGGQAPALQTHAVGGALPPYFCRRKSPFFPTR